MKRVFILLLFGSCIFTSTAFAQLLPGCVQDSSGLITCSEETIRNQSEIPENATGLIITNENSLNRNGIAVLLVTGSIVDLSNLTSTHITIDRSDLTGAGAYAHGAGNKIVLSNSTTVIKTNGGAAGVYADDHGEIVINDNTKIYATVENGTGVRTGSNSMINIDGSLFVEAVNGTGSFSLQVYSGTANTNSTISTNGYQLLNIQGNMRSYADLGSSTSNLTLKADTGSIINGNAIMDGVGDAILDIYLKDSIWRMNSNSSVTTLDLQDNSNVYLYTPNNSGSNPTFADMPAVTLNINDLNGFGTFYQRLNIVNDVSDGLVNRGDLIVVNDSSSGNFNLKFDDSQAGSILNDNNRSFIVVSQNSSTGSYGASYTGQADIGAYIYTVSQLNQSTNTDNSWYLQYDTTKNNNSTGNNTEGGGTGELNNNAKASLGILNINYLMGIIETQTLLQRMGELDTNRVGKDDVWSRVYRGRLNNFNSQLGVDKADYYGLQAGIDRVYNGGNFAGDYYLGFMVGYSKADIDFIVGDGSVNSYTMGVYGSYKDPNGFYIDGVVKYTHLKSKYNTLTSNNFTVNGESSVNGAGVSLEIGKTYNFENSKIYLEPQTQLSYIYQDGMRVQSSSNLVTSVDSYHSILARASIVLGYRKNENINFYFKSGYVADLNGKLDYKFNNDKKLKHRINGDWWDNAIGVTTTINDNHHIYIEASHQLGDEFNNMKINGGYRYRF